MDAIKDLVIKHQDKFKFLIYAGVGIAGFNCLTRPDYNLIIYLYIYYIWFILTDNKETQSKEKTSAFFFLAYSLVIDFSWTIFWSGKWGHIKHDFEKSIHILVVLMSWVAIILKVIY
jgi:hypothetical protein